MNIPQLAIVLPAYKSTFLADGLQSICRQTNNSFHVYIGDDDSPETEKIQKIVQEYETKMPLTYHRFDKNLGSISLTKQWERCIALSQNEPFIWLFSDDDVMPPDAVERFYKTITLNKYPVYRFELELINSAGKVINRNKGIFEKERGIDFIKRRLKFEVHSSVTEFIFRRDAFLKHGGFIDFPLAWSSDTATMVKLCEDSYIYTIPGRPVQWRTQDSTNISSSDKFTSQKLQGQLNFVEWICSYFPEFKKKSDQKLIDMFLLKVSGYMFEGKLNKEQLASIYNIYRLLYGTRNTLLFQLKMKYFLAVYLPYKTCRRKVVRWIKR